MSQLEIPLSRYPYVVAIDGPAASGKGTVARRLARYLDLRYLDTGMLYRAVAAKGLASGVTINQTRKLVEAARNITESDLRAVDLRSEEIGQMASKVAAIAEVREALLAYQREFAMMGKGAVIDGRDIGTVVCPHADVKMFVTASVETRAMRRFKELQERDKSVIYEHVLQDLRERDARDQNREVAPLVQAKEAYLIDTTNLDADAVFEAVIFHVRSDIQKTSLSQKDVV